MGSRWFLLVYTLLFENSDCAFCIFYLFDRYGMQCNANYFSHSGLFSNISWFFQPPFISTPCFSRVYPITKSVTYHGKLPGEKEREREVAELLN
jgi:hypothetical protein